MISLALHGPFFLHNKSEVRNHIVSFVAYIENHFKATIQTIRTDNGAKFAMKFFFFAKGIVHQTTCVETPEQNGMLNANINIF